MTLACPDAETLPAKVGVVWLLSRSWGVERVGKASIYPFAGGVKHRGCGGERTRSDAFPHHFPCRSSMGKFSLAPHYWRAKADFGGKSHPRFALFVGFEGVDFGDFAHSETFRVVGMVLSDECILLLYRELSLMLHCTDKEIGFGFCFQLVFTKVCNSCSPLLLYYIYY